MEPSLEQIAWATMVIGELSPIIHDEPERSWFFKGPSRDEQRAFKSLKLMMLLADKLAEREAKK